MTAFVTTAHIYSQKSHTDGVLKGLWCVCVKISGLIRFTLYMPFRPYPGSEADLLYGKSVKQNLERFMALYSSIILKGRTDRESLRRRI